MRRSPSRDNSSSVSLFPFLAVLLCTMGGLVVLLVAVSHVSREMAKREKAKAEAAAAVAAPDDGALARLAELKERTAEYARREAEAKESVRQDQLRLAQVEEHVRKLQDEMRMVLVAAQELEADKSQRYDDRAQAERELARLEQLVDDTKLEIERQRQKTKGTKQSFAVVPYRGASGTKRQPIYIECTADRVLLQPEGIELTPDDFAPPLGVGNPLAAALRAARDHMVRENPSAGADPDAEPYPLILVRPAGIGAYYRVREAIRSWDAEFGYEMIDGDWDLAFAPPDPQLANVELRAINNARLRREVLASAAPSAFSGGGGTFAIPVEEDPLPGEHPYDPAVLGGGVAGATGMGSGAGTHQGGLAGGSQGYSEQPYGSGPHGSGQGGGGLAGSGSGRPGQPNGGGQPSQPGFDQHQQAQADAGQQGSGGWAATGSLSPAQEGYPDGGSDALNGPGGPSAAQTAAGGPSGQAMGGAEGIEQSGSPTSPGGSMDGTVAGAAGGGQNASAGAGGGAASSSGVSMSVGGSNGSVASLNAKQRPDDVAIRRTVKVSVFSDRLLVGQQPTPLAMPGPTSVHINEFVASVKQQIESWGLAGSGLYWRPIIKLDVRQGGEQRAAEIERILTRSGVDIEPVKTANRTNGEPASGAR
ncbi:hypothetical protein KOR34_10980 [Posidoniimonas corsicana]|uniref:IncA protein n=1 Tax=Posidoniimonas corsicana TaxID=1938618 RepID=A0A5C5VE20_9BACT|nr:hypothetical protein [Posidoniimonas corsicana]TWT36197.1 hypothetical protein KOR34_10980 [Posidoniimonas corsicana]